MPIRPLKKTYRHSGHWTCRASTGIRDSVGEGDLQSLQTTVGASAASWRSLVSSCEVTPILVVRSSAAYWILNFTLHRQPPLLPSGCGQICPHPEVNLTHANPWDLTCRKTAMPAKSNRPLCRDNKRWDHACDQDERDTVSVGSVSSGALFDRRRPGTGTAA